nr:cytochrome P450 89A2-like [Ipomoea batatas]
MGPLSTLRIGPNPAIFVASPQSRSPGVWFRNGAVFSDRPKAPRPPVEFVSSNQCNISSAPYGPHVAAPSAATSPPRFSTFPDKVLFQLCFLTILTPGRATGLWVYLLEKLGKHGESGEGGEADRSLSVHGVLPLSADVLRGWIMANLVKNPEIPGKTVTEKYPPSWSRCHITPRTGKIVREERPSGNAVLKSGGPGGSSGATARPLWCCRHTVTRGGGAERPGGEFVRAGVLAMPTSRVFSSESSLGISNGDLWKEKKLDLEEEIRVHRCDEEFLFVTKLRLRSSQS